MKDKEKDKRLLIPGDAFEEEASEGLGRLSREEAEADLRELKGRMERRISRPRSIWLPAAAAVAVVLVASALYVSVFRERSPDLPGIARSEREKSDRGAAADAEKKKGDSSLIAISGGEMRDTALIAMAAPIEKKDMETVSTRRGSIRGMAAAASEEKPSSALIADERYVLNEAVVTEDEVIQVVAEAQHEEPAAEEIIVEALPMMKRAALRTTDTSKSGADESPAAASKEKAAGKETAVTSDSVRPAAVPSDAARPAAVPSDAARPAAAGYDAVKPAAAVKDATVQAAIMPDRAAMPVGGWDEYREWMVRNLRYPGGIEPVEREVVQVSFTVKADSTLTDLKTLSTPGELFTSEAFRLLREGPKWIPAMLGGRVVEQEVRVSILFN